MLSAIVIEQNELTMSWLQAKVNYSPNSLHLFLFTYSRRHSTSIIQIPCFNLHLQPVPPDSIAKPHCFHISKCKFSLDLSMNSTAHVSSYSPPNLISFQNVFQLVFARPFDFEFYLSNRPTTSSFVTFLAEEKSFLWFIKILADDEQTNTSSNC
jgi:hypothetical protein